jgi:hypothetical protein
MKIIDTFLFSEPYEDDLLYIKLKLENNAVDYFFIQENAYTLQGDYKGLHAKEVIKQSRFDEFRAKIVVVSADYLYKSNDKSENINFERENWQRTIASSIILEHLSKQDVRIIVSDVDESLDFSDEDRTIKISNIIRNIHSVVYIGRMRYWYDYDNRCFLPNIRIPIVHIKELITNPNILGFVRHWQGLTYDAGEEPLAFEYSYVFRNMEDVWRKKCTYAHTNFTEESISIALECNHWPRPIERGEKLGDNQYDFFEKVELTQKNSPLYIRENLSSLKTNIVNPDYKNLRKQRYGI